MPNTLLTAERGVQGETPSPEIIEPSIASAGVSTPDVAMTGSTEFAQDIEKVFTYAHGDGHEFSGTLEQARKICPVIGRMSVEKAAAALQESDLAARIAQKGREKRQAELAKATEGKERPQPPVDGKKLQDEPALQVEIQSRPVVHDSSKDMLLELQVEDMRSAFLAQQEASVAATTTAEVRREEPTARVANTATVREVAPTIIEPEPILAANTATFINTEAAIRADDSVEVVYEETPQSLGEQLDKNIEGQHVPEVVLTNLDEQAEPIEMSEYMVEYDRQEENNAMLLMPEPEQSAINVEVNSELPLVEIIADTPEPEGFEFTPAEIQAVASVPELPARVEEIESAITELTAALESKEVHQIVEEIIALPDTLEASSVEAKAAVEEKLKVLFIRLFEQTGTMYTPELIESFVKLTQAHYLKELLPVAIETEDDERTLPDTIGTREFMQKLQHGLSVMKQAVIHFYEIGKSVLRVYGLAGSVPKSAV